MTENRVTLHIKWFNKEKTEGEALLKDNGQPLLKTERIDDARLLKNILNELYDENNELRQDNDIKFWKHQFIMEYNASKIMMHEISRVIDEGYEISEEFQKYLNELRVQNDKNKEKMERLRI